MPVRSLLEPIEASIAAALHGHWRPSAIALGEVDAGFWRLDGDLLVLSADFEVEGASHPREPQTGAPPLDRWRRALMSVLEASATRELADATGAPPDLSAWGWAGFAAYEADRRAPGLGLAAPDLALAWAVGDLGACPRAGAAVMLAWRARGEDPGARARALVTGTPPAPDEWLALAAWMASSEGLFPFLPVAVPRRPAADVPLTLPPWSFTRVEVVAHRRGGQVQVSGPGAIAPAWAIGGQVLAGVAAAADGEATFTPSSGGPIGTWSVRSSAGFGQVFGARGMDFRFRGSGAFEVILADAFVGPVQAIGEADRYGTTGIADGTWRVTGPHTLRLGEIRTHNMTVHGRSRREPVLPSESAGMAPMLRGMEDSEWRWERDGDALRLFGRLMGGAVEIRLERASD